MEKNKTGKYFKYAIVEIVLVVIGILIALQINNWNENRISQAKSKYYYQRIVEDLDFMVATLETRIKRGEFIRKHVASATHILKKGVLTEKNKDTLDFAFNAYYQFNGINSNLNSIEELKSSGQFGLIRDKNLRKELADYTSYLNSVSDIFNIIKKEMSNIEAIEQYIFNDVAVRYKDNKIVYDFDKIKIDKKTINKLSRIALNWQTLVDFSETLLKQTKSLKEKVLKHISIND